MKISDYPGNEEVVILRKIVMDLEKDCEWQALYHATIDLKHELMKREEWIKKNVDN